MDRREATREPPVASPERMDAGSLLASVQTAADLDRFLVSLHRVRGSKVAFFEGSVSGTALSARLYRCCVEIGTKLVPSNEFRRVLEALPRHMHWIW